MAVDKRAFQLQQVLNLVAQQEWTQVSSRFDGPKITLVIRRKFTDERLPVRQFEIDKMVKLVRTFGWTADSTNIDGNAVTVQLVKTLEGEVSS